MAFLLGRGVATEILLEAARVAAQCGVAADVALLRSGLLPEQAFYRALAQELGLPFRDDDLNVHSMARFPEAILTGMVPLANEGPLPFHFAYAPRGQDICRLLAARDSLPPGLSITTPAAIRRSVLVARAGSIAARAADGLARSSPDVSFRAGCTIGQAFAALTFGVVVGVSWTMAPVEVWLIGSILLGLAFLGNTALRLAAVFEFSPISPQRPPPAISDLDLPDYTVLVALHREARVVPKLVRAISALDYPAAKLQVIFILEVDDLATLSALQDACLPSHVEVIVAPPGLPRAKPRALNVALPLARGEFVTVYDAEDVPDPQQLRLAVSTFRRAEHDIACLQARLVIDNSSDSLLTRFFAMEYAALFDVTNPALARFDMPVPLGGTSNHFRGLMEQMHLRRWRSPPSSVL